MVMIMVMVMVMVMVMPLLGFCFLIASPASQFSIESEH